MRRRMFPNFVGDVVELEERQERTERVMQMLGVTPEYPYTFNINDGTRNRVRIGVIGADYGIEIVDNAGNSVLLANGTVVANAIKAGTLDCNLITVANLSATVITTGSLSATRISGGILDCNLMTVQNLSAGAITVGTFASPNDRFTAGSISGIKLADGTITGVKLVAYTIQADNIATNAISSDKIQAGAIIASKISVTDLASISANIGTITAGNITANIITAGTLNVARIADSSLLNAKLGNDLSANKITAGQLTVGGAGAVTAIYLRRSSSSTPGEADTFIRWEGGSRMWSDNSNNMGINAIGGSMYIYTNSGQRMYISSGNTNIYSNTLYCHNINLSLDGVVESSISNIDRLIGYNDLWIVGKGDIRFPRDDSDNAGVRFQWGTGKIYSYSSSINLGGTDKTAIVLTKGGFKALYCAESPEVWFFDFCESKEKIDPTFLEVTVAPYRFIKCEDGGYQVWGKRKGHEEKRFEAKTQEEFEKNEEFLNIPKISVQFTKKENNL